MKRILLFVIFFPIFVPCFEVSAFNETSKRLLNSLFEKGVVASREELMEMLLPVAKDETLAHMQKVRDMSYLVHISGWHISKSKKNELFYDVYKIIDLERKIVYLKNHPDLDEQTRKAIQSGDVLIGMSKENVKASLGKPEEIKPAIGTFANTERWSYYTKRMVVFFKDGFLTFIKKL